jgi:F420-0:gamma-glutamyl ligase-like protein
MRSNPAPIFCLDDATRIRMHWFGTRWHRQIWIAVVLATLQGAEALDNMAILSERQLQVVEENQVRGWGGRTAIWSAWLIVWLTTFVIGYKLGHQQAVKQHLVKEAAVQTDEGTDDLDRGLVDIMNNTYTVDILRKAAQQHGCCPGSGARKLNVIETLVRHRKVTRVNHAQVMSATARSVH